MTTHVLLCALALQGIFDGASTSYKEKLTRPGGVYSQRFEACLEIAEEAEGAGIPPALAVSVAWSESKFKLDALSGANAFGPLQVIPKHHPPPNGWEKTDPHLLKHGVNVLLKFLLIYGCEVPETESCSTESSERCRMREKALKRRRGKPLNGCDYDAVFESLCHYNSGVKCYRRSRQYARNILRRAWLWEVGASAVGLRLPLFDDSSPHGDPEGDSPPLFSPPSSGCGESFRSWHDAYIADHCERCPECCVTSEGVE